MDKQEERKAFDAIFGKSGLTVEEGERPDFVCSRTGNLLFGVEITEFFWTESDARLRKIESYVSDLISGGQHRHKDDIKEIVVEDVVYHVAATGQQIPMKAIGRMIPPHQASIPKLLDAISAKNGKAAEYAKRVSTTDLIVADVDRLLRFDGIQQLLEPIILGSDSATVFGSPFREIYLITQGPEKDTVYVPLRANLLASEVALFSTVFRDFQQEVHGQPSVGEYLEALSAYLATRLPGISYFNDSDNPHFVFGSIAWGMTSDQHIKLIDISCEDTSGYVALTPDVDVARLPERLLEMTAERRVTEFFGYELYFPVANSTCSI
jgi:hypothetical protein